MKRYLLLFILTILISSLNAQDFYQFRTNQPQGFSIEASNETGLSLHYSVPEIGIATIDNGEAKGHEILLKGSFGSLAEGLPNIPFENRYIAVPQGATVSIEVKENGSQTLSNIDLLPAADLKGNGEAGLPKLRKNMDVFGKDANFPKEVAAIAQTTQIRGLDVVLLNVTPFRYNPVRQTLEVLYDIDIDIRFEGGNGTFGQAKYLNPAWEGILRDLVLNGDMLPEAHYYERVNEAIQGYDMGCEYLIITPDDSAFMAWADTLKQFRSQQGILTKVVTTADCGGNEAVNIRNYIVDAYNNWFIPPATILLFGGYHVTQPNFGLKPYFHTSPVSWGHTYTYPTDNPFADMNGDSIPDLSISRILAYNANDCQQQVKKLIDYELNPSTDPHYYDHPIITSGYEDNKWFTLTAQIVNNFFANNLGKHPTNLYMKYYLVDNDPTPPDSIWSIGYNTESVLNYFGPNGTNYIPLSLSYLNQWVTMEDGQLLAEAINDGGFLTFYRDHASSDSWCCPWLGINDVPNLRQKNPTFIFSIGCSNNSFWDNWSVPMCLSEAFLRADEGAIGVIGANSVTYSYCNDLITWGMLDYFWPNFLPTLGSHTEPLYAYPSYSIIAGKLFLCQQSFLPYSENTEKVDMTLNLFSLLGDAYLNLFTETPQLMDLFVPSYQVETQHEITVNAEEGALVCITFHDEILHIEQSTGGPQTFSLPEMAPGEQFQVTATKAGFARYQKNVTIIPASGSYLVMEGYTLNDESGNGELESDEVASIDLSLYNAGILAAEGIEITLTSESPYVEILEGMAICPTLQPNENLQIQDAFRLRIADSIPNQTEVDFHISLDNGSMIQTYDLQYFVSAPTLNIKHIVTLRTEEQQNTTHILNEGRTEIGFQISNSGQYGSGPVEVDLEILAPFITIETPRLFLEDIPTDSTVSLIFPVETQPNDLEGAWIKARLHLNDGNNEILYEPTIQYGGIFENFETDTLHPFFTWENYEQYPWQYNNTNAIEGQRCFEVTPPKNKPSRLLITTDGYIPEGTMSFYAQTGPTSTGLETLIVKEKLSTGAQKQEFTAAEWTYFEASVYAECSILDFEMVRRGTEDFGVRIDDICFPPSHNPIAFAGDDMLTCKGTDITLSGAAYDCDSVYWSTDGDGYFDDSSLATTIYHPGDQDNTNGQVILTIHAISANNTMDDAMVLTLLDNIQIEGHIHGDSLVNKDQNLISHYSIEKQEGIRYQWQLEPASAGQIFSFDNAINIVWDRHVEVESATLTVTANNGCDNEPVSMHITFTGYSTRETQDMNFDLFPNPTDGKVNLVMGDNIQGKISVEIFSLMGECMMQQTYRNASKGESLAFNLKSFAPGLYIIKINTEKGCWSKKVSVR